MVTYTKPQQRKKEESDSLAVRYLTDKVIDYQLQR